MLFTKSFHIVTAVQAKISPIAVASQVLLGFNWLNVFVRCSSAY